MTQPTRVNDYLGHVRDAIERIDQYTADLNETAFLNDVLVQDAVIRNFEVIGLTPTGIAELQLGRKQAA